jgi:hydrogenase maturation protease
MNVRLLVIGYGNELRRDDAVGPCVARIVSGWERPDVKALAVHQLTPELAELLATTERTIFVDAGEDEEGVVWTRMLEPARTSRGLGHTCDPRELLALTEALYGRHPEAWLITVPAPNLDFGDCLSAATDRGRGAALRQIRVMAGDFVSVTVE